MSVGAADMEKSRSRGRRRKRRSAEKNRGRSGGYGILGIPERMRPPGWKAKLYAKE